MRSVRARVGAPAAISFSMPSSTPPIRLMSPCARPYPCCRRRQTPGLPPNCTGEFAEVKTARKSQLSCVHASARALPLVWLVLRVVDSRASLVCALCSCASLACACACFAREHCSHQLTATFWCPSLGGRPSCSERGLGSPSASTFAHTSASPFRGETASFR